MLGSYFWGRNSKRSGTELQACPLQETYGFEFRPLPWPGFA